MPPQYRIVHEWIHAPLSDEGRLFRLRAIGTAFGLTEHYLVRRYMPQGDLFSGMGHLLEKEIIDWIGLHPDLEQNNPEFWMTDWADLKTDG